MIVVCEPQVKGMSHEKVNSGFIYGLRLAYPQDKILFYADVSHIQGIKNILEHDRVIIDNIEYIPIKFYDPYNFRGIITYRNLLKKMYTSILAAGTNKIFFLSTNPILLYLIKRLKMEPCFRNIQCTSVCHIEFENIAYGEYREPPVAVFPVAPFKEKIIAKSLAERIHKIASFSVGELLRNRIELIKRRIIRLMNKIVMIYSEVFKRYFYIKKILLWRHSSDFHYVVLSPHVIHNAAEYIDVKNLNFYGIVMPIVFAKPTPQPNNEFVKFAVFGYGDSSMLYKVSLLLSQKEITNPYEIRVIGMDTRGTAGFPNIHCVSPGKVMLRSEMEKYAQDIDVFLIIYDKSRYRLSCSGSILEALSNTKPILHLSNDSIDYFNKQEAPIGFCCVDLEEFADKMADIINKYSTYKRELQVFRENIISLREDLSMERLAPIIKSSFTFD